MAASAPVKTLRATGPVIIVILVVAVALLGYFQLVYYPSIAPTSTTTSSTTTIAVDPIVVNVTIPDGASDNGMPTSFYYQPDVVTVYIGYNATVRWTNNDTGVMHTVTADGTPPDPRFATFGPSSSPYNNVYPVGLGTPTEVNFTFTIPGDYNYSCSYHPWMKGEVIVETAPSGLVTNSTSSASTVSNTSTVATSAAILPGIQLDSATAFASSLATRTGSGIAPWSVNLFSSLFEAKGLIPAALTKTS